MNRIFTHNCSGFICLKSFIKGCEELCDFTTLMDIGENVLAGLKVAVEDKKHGELRKDKAQLMRRRKGERRLICFHSYKYFSYKTHQESK